MNKNENTILEKTDRRQFLKDMTRFVGGAAAAGLLANNGLAVAMAYEPAASNTPALFNSSQMSLLQHICNVVIPRTDTPGAGEVGVHGFIDNQLYHCFSPAEQQQVVAVLARVQQAAEKSFNNNFSKLSNEQQIKLLTRMELGEGNFDQTDRQQFKFLKTLICFGYYTSEVGATQELAYQAIPGGFRGEVPFDEVGKPWGSLAYY
ncbi:gluconate 2-dehydrogenase subunit 3 family protein [Alteromonadaceae bacterium BrNp21-10]|nr:gluconate 2-dehydrogenase subunit 3 family protein [Alteromonadaceae bacterium BrNp21-10]